MNRTKQKIVCTAYALCMALAALMTVEALPSNSEAAEKQESRFTPKVITQELLVNQPNTKPRISLMSDASLLFKENYPWSYWSMGLSLGTAFTTPGLTVSPNITIPLVKIAYLDLGCDLGFFTNTNYTNDLSYNSYYPYIRASAFLPFDLLDDYDAEHILKKFGFHIGLGYGCMIANYQFGDYNIQAVVNTFNLAVGFLIMNSIDISYSVRVAKREQSKLSIGYVYRFGKED
ncbi:MAG: hypothetical protein LBO67_05705 [Spirochaetaceae bacterium]|jgi:hypothetical protein|nr:hypothetical protein [Spirochaetaceae bacterium]